MIIILIKEALANMPEGYNKNKVATIIWQIASGETMEIHVWLLHGTQKNERETR